MLNCSKGKGKFHPRKGHKDPERERERERERVKVQPHSSLTSALNGAGGHRHARVTLLRKRDPVAILRGVVNKFPD